MKTLTSMIKQEIKRVGKDNEDLDFALSCVINSYCLETKEDYYRIAQIVDLDFNTNTIDAI